MESVSLNIKQENNKAEITLCTNDICISVNGELNEVLFAFGLIGLAAVGVSYALKN